MEEMQDRHRGNGASITFGVRRCGTSNEHEPPPEALFVPRIPYSNCDT